MTTIVCLCIFAVGLLFSLCCFAVSIYTLVLCTNLSKELMRVETAIPKEVDKKLEEINGEMLEPGVYMPRKDIVTGEMGYSKMDMDNWMSKARNKEEQELVKSLLEITGEENGG